MVEEYAYLSSCQQQMADSGSFGFDFRKRTMGLERTESVRAALNRSSAREQRHARVFTHEAPCLLDGLIVRVRGIAHSCLLTIVNK
jgi:hypothetical protein